MLLQPKRLKYRKPHKGVAYGTTKNGHMVAFAQYGLKSMDAGFISDREIEAARKVIVRRIKKIGKLWIRIFPSQPITKGGLEMPMGKGKGDIDHYAAKVKKGRMLFEIGGATPEIAKEALFKASHKLSVRAKVVEKGYIK